MLRVALLVAEFAYRACERGDSLQFVLKQVTDYVKDYYDAVDKVTR